MTALIVLIATCLTSCGDETAGPNGSGDRPFSVPVGTGSFDVHAPTWLREGEIHVGDEVYAPTPEPTSYVVTPTAIYYASHNGLYSYDGAKSQRFLRSSWPYLSLSADDHYLGVIDDTHGPADEYDTSAAVPTVVDLETGKVILRVEPGQDALKNADLADLYGEVDPSFQGFIGDEAIIFDPLQEPDAARYPLAGGEPTEIPKDGDGQPTYPEVEDQFGWRVRVYEERSGAIRMARKDELSYFDAYLSPDKKWMFKTVNGYEPEFYDPKTGAPQVLKGVKGFRLGGWVDDDTFYGLAGSVNREGLLLRAPHRIVQCETATRVCTDVSEPFDANSGEGGLVFANGDNFGVL